MTALVHDLAGVGAMGSRSQASLTTDVFTDLAAVEALWRGLEADPGVLATPYQRFDWVTAYLRAEPEIDLRVLVMRDAAGRPRVLIPLGVTREHGVRVARVVGARHANYHMPLYASREAAAMRPEDLAEQLRQVGRRLGIDVFALAHQPRFWDGAANPLSVRSEPAPSNAYGLILGPDPEATVRRIFSAEARKKLRSKEKRLVEAFGPVEYRLAATPEEAETFLAAFYGQKATRFARKGIANPYAEMGVRDFIAAGLRPRGGAASPVIEVAALVARESGRIFAVFAGAVDGIRYSGMMTSFDQDPAIGRSSPGDILLHRLIMDQTARGRRAFDLGVGEARYKANICDETIALREATIPVSLSGHLFAVKAVGLARLKRRLKRNCRLVGLVTRLRCRRHPAATAA